MACFVKEIELYDLSYLSLGACFIKNKLQINLSFFVNGVYWHVF
jgi:hypothetical protein